MRFTALLLGAVAASSRAVLAACPDYTDYSEELHAPFSGGKYNLSYMRPDPSCRTFVVPEVDSTIAQMKSIVKDPDLYRLFENSFPNTLDTTVRWTGYANNGTEEELAFIITGDITAMWLRDSANQLRSYKSFLQANSTHGSLASLFRGAVNLQSRYVITSPHCNSFQPPAESGLAPSTNGAASDDTVYPPYNASFVFECKYELDSLAAFLQLSSDYYTQTKDASFFAKFQWPTAIETVLNVTEALLVGTYGNDGIVNQSPYTFTRQTTSGTETLSNSGIGNPTKEGTGLVRSAFRPSDDATIYQLFVPANMMFSNFLGECATIMETIDSGLASRMTSLSTTIRNGIEKYGKVNHPEFGTIYAYEMDGFGSHNLMDDANLPSLLGAPTQGFLNTSDPVYQATRKYVLSTYNPYYMQGPVINAVGGPHDGPGKAWPMAVIAQLLTSSNDSEIITGLKTLVSSTDQLGLIHESIQTYNQSVWTRQWFAWANGLFGEMLLDLKSRKPQLLKESFQ
ncbi:glycoside hydrolase family 125 protein [Xylariaceae sp. FL0255]|nr:glycoside hydrolase family 125 protein [Xylariaceae sp. FL0255]